LTFGKNAVNLIKQFEGCKLNAYQDCVGVWTIGYGCTSGVTPGTTITQQNAEDMLNQALIAVSDALSVLVTYSASQNEFDALTSFTYNLGTGALQSSTLLRLLNAGDIQGAAQEFPKWCHAGGKIEPGLVSRRAAEMALFLQRELEQPEASAARVSDKRTSARMEG
jgi:lysozyme